MRTRIFIYLASKSPRRRSLLKRMRIPFRVVPSRYDEKRTSDRSPSRVVMKHALGKACCAILPRRRVAGLVLGADTVVYCRQRIFGKPKGRMDAIRTLSFLSGRPHDVYTGLVLLDRGTGKTVKGFAKTRVVLDRMSKAQIRAYFKRVEPEDKAGSYAIQKGDRIVREIRGSYSNVMGLPADLLWRMLGKARKRHARWSMRYPESTLRRIKMRWPCVATKDRSL